MGTRTMHARTLADTNTDTTTAPDQKPRRILVLDGGGMRGLSTIAILKHLREHHKITLADFDLIAGTSAGGLIALSALMGLDLDSTEALFLEVGQTIFKRAWGSGLINTLQHLWSGWRETPAPGRYPLQTYEETITRLMAEHTADFGKTTGELGSDATKPKIFAVATDISMKDQIQPFLLRSYELPRQQATKTSHLPMPSGTSNIPVVKAAVATSAAPYYFDANVTVGSQQLVDGDVGYNNPIMLALHECMRLYGWGAQVDLIVSIGTGLPALDILKTQHKSSADWATTVVDVATNSDLTHRNFQLMRPLLSDALAGAVYARFDPPHLGS